MFEAGCSTVTLDASFRDNLIEGVALNANCVPSLEVLRFAAARAAYAHMTGTNKARTITAEFVLAISPIKSIGESFRRFASKPAESAGPIVVARIRQPKPAPGSDSAAYASSSSSASDASVAASPVAAVVESIEAWAKRCGELVGADPTAATSIDEALRKGAELDAGRAAIRKAFKLSDDDLASATSLQEACIDVIGANE
jgi:hypothetical protein